MFFRAWKNYYSQHFFYCSEMLFISIFSTLLKQLSNFTREMNSSKCQSAKIGFCSDLFGALVLGRIGFIGSAHTLPYYCLCRNNGFLFGLTGSTLAFSNRNGQSNATICLMQRLLLSILLLYLQPNFYGSLCKISCCSPAAWMPRVSNRLLVCSELFR